MNINPKEVTIIHSIFTNLFNDDFEGTMRAFDDLARLRDESIEHVTFSFIKRLNDENLKLIAQRTEANAGNN